MTQRAARKKRFKLDAVAPRPSETKAQLREKLAAVLRDLMVDVDGKLERAIPYEDAKQMTADEIIEKFDFDHGIHHAIDGEHVHWNYTARIRAAHRTKTNEIDIPQIAKTKRILKEQQAFRDRMTAKTEVLRDPTKNPAKPKATIKSRGFAGSRKFDGTVVWKGKSD